MRKNTPTLFCFSHLRWNFVYQRPQHLISRIADHYPTFYIEEPIFDAQEEPFHCITEISSSLHVIVPHLVSNSDSTTVNGQLASLLKNILAIESLESYIFWYYTPMAMEFTNSFNPVLVIYDCMDELSAFKFAPEKIKELEYSLLQKAGLVFTGGHTLYQEKKKHHSNIFPFPSSIDKDHFLTAREGNQSPQDQAGIQGLKLGFFGVIDERFDINLIAEMASMRPEWQFILIGPVVKIDPQTLPRRNNIHYLGQRSYQELPAYLSGWDIALIPFMLNDSTKYISPTKTPEYLAAGKPVLSTAITDVVNPYGNLGLVHICASADEFVQAAEKELNQVNKQQWLESVDEFIKDLSWDNTAAEILNHIESELAENLTIK